MSTTIAEIDGLPHYTAIAPAQIEQTIDDLIDDNKREIDITIEASGSAPTWDTLVAPLEELEDRLAKAWAPISHLNAVVSTPELRAAHDACVAKLTQYETQLGQSQPLYQAYKSVVDGDAFAGLDDAQRKVITDAVLGFELSGVGLPEAEKQRFAEVSERLAQLASEFSNNVLDATDAWTKHITDVADLAGLPEVNVAMAEQAARSRDLEGYVLTLEMPSYAGVLDHAEDRDLRREVHEAFVTRASDRGPNAGEFDNTDIIDEILTLRRELALLLGYANYAEVSVVRKMAQNASEVQAFLDDLLARSLPKAREDIEELRQFGRDRYGIDDVCSWDVRFLTERLRNEKYAVSEEALRPYFPLDKVLGGMFEVVERLYDLQIQAAEAPDQWHEDVRFFEVARDGERIARFYLDPFARPAKRGGAWMADCRIRREAGNFLQLPVAYLTCNFASPVAGQPALLTHREVVTLFHEFGHGLHHMLTRQTHAPVSGINGVSWDAVELPSQFMENWCWQRDSIGMISSHWQTGEHLPEELLDKLLKAKNFQSGVATVRQLEFGLFDMAIHATAGAVDPLEAIAAVRERTAVIDVPSYDRFPWAFGHIFAGGYAAGYYSYLWAEVLSADAFAAFEETGIFDKQTGRRFLTEVLEVGGAKEAMDMFKAFRGREPDPSALLRHTGLG